MIPTTEQMDALWVQLARLDPMVFATYVFAQDNGSPLLPSSHHKIWHKFFTEHNRGVILAPPGVGKSVQITQARMLWEVSRHPEKSFAIISRNLRRAQKNLAAIKDIIEHNPRYSKVFPETRIDPANWNKSALTLINRPQGTGAGEATLQAIGVSGALMGARLHGIVVDDPQDQTNVSSMACADLVEWFESVPLSRLPEDGSGFCYVISNSWSQSDLAHHLIEQGWDHWSSPLVIDYGTPDATSIWPERISIDQARTIEAQLSQKTFRRLYLNDVSLDNQSYIDQGWVTVSQARYDPAAQYPRVYIGVDLASRLNDKADQTSFCVVLYNTLNQQRCLSHSVSGRWDFPEIMRRLKTLTAQYPLGATTLTIESNGAQEYVVQQAQRDLPQIKIISHATTKSASLPTLFDRWSVELSQGLWAINPSTNNLMVNARQWRDGDHMPDDVAALLIALSQIPARPYTAPVQVNAR